MEDYLFKNGEYSFNELYNLTNKYIKYLSNQKNPFNTIYPIVISKKTYLNNLALFIACLELNLNPAPIDLDEIDLSTLGDYEYSDNHNFYIASSGTSGKPKLKELNEKELLDYDSYKDLKGNYKEGNIFYNASPLCNISGIQPIIIATIFANLKLIISNGNNFINDLYTKEVSYTLLPVTVFYDLIINLKDLKKYNNKFEFFVLSGDEVNINKTISFLKNSNSDLDLHNFYYAYGQTETYGYRMGLFFDEVKKVKVDCNTVFKNLKMNIDINDFSKQVLNIKNNINKVLDNQDIHDYLPLVNYKYYDDLDRIFDGYKNLNYNFVSIGRKTDYLSLDSYPFGELIVNGIKTGDICYLYEDYFYFVCRKDFKENLLSRIISNELKINCYFVKNEKKSILVINKNIINSEKSLKISKLLNEFDFSSLNYNISNKVFFIEKDNVSGGVGKKLPPILD